MVSSVRLSNGYTLEEYVAKISDKNSKEHADFFKQPEIVDTKNIESTSDEAFTFPTDTSESNWNFTLEDILNTSVSDTTTNNINTDQTKAKFAEKLINNYKNSDFI